MGKVTMFNPKSEVTQEASEDAFHRVYAPEGWQLADTPAAPEVDPDLVAARAEADEAGVAWHPNAKADSIRAKVAEARKAAEAEAEKTEG